MMEVARWKWHKNAQEWGKSSTKGQEDAWKMLHRGEKRKGRFVNPSGQNGHILVGKHHVGAIVHVSHICR